MLEENIKTSENNCLILLFHEVEVGHMVRLVREAEKKHFFSFLRSSPRSFYYIVNRD